MTHPTDAAIAQAFRERLESMYSPLTVREVMKAVEARARELDAEKGGLDDAKEALLDTMRYGIGVTLNGKRVPPDQVTFFTPPAQAAEAAEARFFETVRDARKVWMEENPCEEGHDHVTPFDQFLYGEKGAA